MINKPKNGWSSWQIEEFNFPISYVDDFPFVFLNKILDFFNKEEPQEYEFDAEGFYYTIYLGFPVYGKIDNDKDEFIQISDNMIEFTQNLLYDLERDIKEWSEFPSYCETERDALFIEKEIEAKIKEVRGAMKKWMEKMV